MNSRMDRYENSAPEMSRAQKNRDIYSSTDIGSLSKLRTNDNVSVISDAHKEIDIEKIKKYVSLMENKEEEQRQRITLNLPEEKQEVVEERKEKVYNINSILEHAKTKREVDYAENRHRKFDNSQMEILRKIELKQESEKDDDITGPIEELNTQEKTIVDLINDIKNNSEKSKTKDLFSDLMADGDETIVGSISNEDDNEKLKEDLLTMTQDLEAIKDKGNEFTKEMNDEKDKLKELLALEELKTEEYDKLEQSEGNDEDEEEREKIGKVDKSFYTNSMSFNKSDFEGFEDLERSESKGNALTTIVIIIVVILLLVSVFFVLNYLLGWNII